MSIGAGIAIFGIWLAVAAVAFSEFGEFVIIVALFATLASCGVAHG